MDKVIGNKTSGKAKNDRKYSRFDQGKLTTNEPVRKGELKNMRKMSKGQPALMATSTRPTRARRRRVFKELAPDPLNNRRLTPGRIQLRAKKFGILHPTKMIYNMIREKATKTASLIRGRFAAGLLNHI